MTSVLIIEDQHDLREDIVEMLMIEGFEVYGAENGVVGINQALAVKPDIIVCDIMMPELDGYGVLEKVRKHPDLSLIPFIFLTAKTDRVNMRYGMVMGADDYLTKPFVVNELLDSIHSQLQKRADLDAAIDSKLELLRDNIITALPHELRTPLNTIIGFSEMLGMEAQQITPAQVEDWAGHINIAAQQLYRLVENYLYFVRIKIAENSPQARDEYKSTVLTDGNVVIEAQAEKVMNRYGRSADLMMNLTPLPPVHFSYQSIVKVVDELLENANKFSIGDTPIYVTGTVQDEFYSLCIEDRGRGITQDQIDNIGTYMQFDRNFYEQQGLGFGLALVTRLVALYDGKIEITSLNQGTRVCVYLALVS